jgi:hypothetical protein
VKVKLVDLAIMATVPRDKLRSAQASLLKEPVVAVSCCLDSWMKEDQKMALDKWGDKMEGILEQYSEVDVEVVNMTETQAQVKIPTFEQKLGKNEMSRAEMCRNVEDEVEAEEVKGGRDYVNCVKFIGFV